jgi:hypothetical protein
MCWQWLGCGIQEIHTGCGGNFMENIHLGRKIDGWIILD